MTIQVNYPTKKELKNQGYTLVKSWTEYPDIWVSMYEYQKKEVA